MLAEKYPKAFFEEPRQRRPLKKNIITDLEKDSFPAARELMVAALDWYQNHFGYLGSLQAGVKRVDLHGKEVDTITEQERNNALKKIQEGRQKQQEKERERGFGNSTATLRSLHAAGRIPDDQLKKLDAQPMTATKSPGGLGTQPTGEAQLKLISRVEALSHDPPLARYFTGKPCKYGHVAERYACSDACVDCLRDQKRERYKAQKLEWS
jgi:sRNA-binding protein